MGSISLNGAQAVYAAPAGPNVTTSDSEIVAANRARNQITLVNDSDEDVYIATDDETAVLNQGIRLNSGGGSAQFGGPGGLALTTGSIRAIHGGTGNKVMAVLEST